MATTTLVVDLQDKYYSKKLDYRYRPPPNVDSCASPDRFDQPSRVRALKNLQDYHPDLIQSLPFLSCAPDRDTSRIFGISQAPRNDVAMMEDGGHRNIGPINTCFGNARRYRELTLAQHALYVRKNRKIGAKSASPARLLNHQHHAKRNRAA